MFITGEEHERSNDDWYNHNHTECDEYYHHTGCTMISPYLLRPCRTLEQALKEAYEAKHGRQPIGTRYWLGYRATR